MTWSNRSIALASAFGILVAIAACQPATAEEVRVTLVQTNDIDRLEAVEDRGGFAKLAAVVADERTKGTVLFVHSGDTISPSLLSGIDKGAHIIDILNQMSVDVMVPGNHEFDFGPTVFQQRLSDARFPIISSNIVMPAGGGPANTAVDRIVDINGVKIGFYGLTTEDTAAISSPGDIVFLDPVEIGIDTARDLRDQGADLVIAVVHTPVDVDFALARADAADIILSGHDEHLMVFHDGKHVITESGAQADFVAITDLIIERTEKDGKVSISWEPDFRIVDTRSFEPDREIAALVRSYTDKLDKELGIEIGTTESPLDSRRATVRGGEAAIGNLIADAMREAVGADIALTNGGGIRADRQYDAGDALTRKDILSELPFDNKTVKLGLTGRQLREALENGFANYPELDGRNPQISGMVVTVDLAEPVGERVRNITIAGAPIDPDKTYTLATNDYLARGGNDYVAFREATTLIGGIDAKLMASDVIDYITAKGTIAPKIEGRILAQ